jgi:hypothetical protein
LVPADKYLVLDDDLVPTGRYFIINNYPIILSFGYLGEIASVENTPFDFRKLTAIGERVNESFDGYDLMFIIDGDGKRPFGK